jgi:hypothetical protein
MSLDFSYKGIDPVLVEHPGDSEEYHPVLQALVWMSLSCGYSRITKDSVDKVYLRVRACQLMHGAFVHKKRETNSISAVYITRRDVEAYVGLTTNATALTDPQFAKRMLAWVKDAPLPRNEGILSDGFLERTAIDIIAEKK